MLEGVIAWLIRHPATIAIALLALTAAASSALAKHEMARANGLERRLETAQASIDSMRQDIQTGEKIANDYQTKISALNRAAAAKRVRGSGCIVPSTASSGSNGASGHGVAVGAHGIGTEWLDDFAAEAESYRIRLIGLQEYVNKVCH